MELSEDLHLVGPGEQLKEARQKLGLTIDEVAERLKLRPSLISQIELEQFDGIPNQTFLRGYLGSYARLVNIPEQQILQALQNLGIAKVQEGEMRSYSRRHKTQSNNSKLMLVSYLVGAGLLGMLLLWWMQEGEQAQLLVGDDTPVPTVVQPLDAEPDYSTPVQPAPVEPADQQDDALMGAEADASPNAADEPAAELFVTESVPPTPVELVTVEPSEPEVLTSANEPTVTPEATPIAEEPVAPLASPAIDVADRLQMEFVGDCWIQVKDSTGRNLIAGIRNNSSPVDVSGKPPYRLVIGAPEQLKELRFEGETVDTANFPAGKVVRITLPQ